MKNTVKKILALVFVVAMVCSLAVPAFAAETFPVNVIVVGADGDILDENVTINVTAGGKKANVLDVLKEADDDATYAFTFKNNAISAVANNGTKIDIDDEFDTETWVVTLNGKTVTGDLSTIAVAKDDVIVVYWADTTIGFKLAMVDDSNIAAGIISFYYYDAEGNKLPIVGAEMNIKKNGENLKNGLTAQVVTAAGANTTRIEYTSEVFVTDEKGQIWISPAELDDKAAITFTIAGFEADVKEVSTKDGYTKEEEAYYNLYVPFSVVDELVKDATITVDANLYDVAGQTGDMTAVYALVAFAAVATLAAVVAMKKKSVKAN